MWIRSRCCDRYVARPVRAGVLREVAATPALTGRATYSLPRTKRIHKENQIVNRELPIGERRAADRGDVREQVARAEGVDELDQVVDGELSVGTGDAADLRDVGA